jgi:plasmid maintenance system antidote protein VapI
MQYDASPLWERMEREGRQMTWLARATGYNRTYLHMIRAGSKPLTNKVMDKIAAAFGADRDALFLSVELHEVSKSLVEEMVAD